MVHIPIIVYTYNRVTKSEQNEKWICWKNCPIQVELIHTEKKLDWRFSSFGKQDDLKIIWS